MAVYLVLWWTKNQEWLPSNEWYFIGTDWDASVWSPNNPVQHRKMTNEIIHPIAWVTVMFWDRTWKYIILKSIFLSKFQVCLFLRSNFTHQYTRWPHNKYSSKYSNIHSFKHLFQNQLLWAFHLLDTHHLKDTGSNWMSKAGSLAFTERIMVYFNFDLTDDGKQESSPFSYVSHRHAFPLTWNSFRIYLPNIRS